MPPSIEADTTAAEGPSRAFGEVFLANGQKRPLEGNSDALHRSRHRTSKGIGAVEVLAEGGDVTIVPTYASDPDAEQEKPVHVYYQVASQVLSTASPTWRAMLGPNSHFKEAEELRKRRKEDNSSPVEVILEEGAEVLHLIFLALHHKNDKLPKEISFELLVTLAEACDKYELHVPLRFWAEKWARPYRNDAFKQRFENWLLIAWVFGYNDVFRGLSRQIIINARIAKRGVLSFGTGTPQDEYSYLSPVVPEVVLSQIIDRRAAVFSNLKALLDQLHQERIDNIDIQEQALGRVVFCKVEEEGHRKGMFGLACDLAQVGYLQMVIAKLLPSSSGNTDNLSLEWAGAWIRTFTSALLVGKKPKEKCHNECSFVPELKKKYATWMDDMEGLDLADFPSRIGCLCDEGPS